MKHLQSIDYRTFFKGECFVFGTREQRTLQELLDRNEAEHESVGEEPILENAGEGDLLVLLFRENYYNTATPLYTQKYPNSHVCVIHRHEHSHNLIITDFKPEPRTRRIENFNARCVRLIKKGTKDYYTVLSLCFHQLVPSVTPIPHIPTSL